MGETHVRCSGFAGGGRGREMKKLAKRPERLVLRENSKAESANYPKDILRILIRGKRFLSFPLSEVPESGVRLASRPATHLCLSLAPVLALDSSPGLCSVSGVWCCSAGQRPETIFVPRPDPVPRSGPDQ